MENNEYTLDRYAQSLTKYDIQTLFRRLAKLKGNIAAATKAAGIKRKTYYDWEKNSDDIKPLTKRKILKACLENDSAGTIEFLLKKDELSYNELLEQYSSILVQEIISEKNPSEITVLNKKFEIFLKTHIGSIQDSKTISVKEVLSRINNKSKASGVSGILDDISFITSAELSDKFIDLINIFKNNPIIPCNQLGEALKLPDTFINKACTIYNYEASKPYSSEATRNNYNCALDAKLNTDRRQIPSQSVVGVSELSEPDFSHLYFAKRRHKGE